MPENSEAVNAEKRAAEIFRVPVLSRTVIVQRNAAGLTADARVSAFSRAAALTTGGIEGFEESILAAFPVINDIGDPPFTKERSTTALTYLIFDPGIGTFGQKRRAERLIREEFDTTTSDVRVTGAVPARAEQIRAIADWLPLVELCTLLLVGLAVGLHFRAVLAPLLTLVTVGLAYYLSSHVVAGVGDAAGYEVPKEVEPVVVVLLFGIITDYAIFFLSRFRRRLSGGEPAREAAEGTIADLVGIILAAGLAVMAGTASLLVAELGFFQVFGPGVAIAVGIGMLAALTFLPAALAATGAALYWPSRPGRDVPVALAAEDRSEAARPVRSRTLHFVAERPLTATIACMIILLAMASGLGHARVGQTLIRGLPEDAEARQAYENAREGFAAGVLAPTVVLMEADDIADRRLALQRVQRGLEELPGVSLVVGPRQQPFSDAFGVVYAPSGDAARFVVVFDSDPLGAIAIRQVRDLRIAVERLLELQGLRGAQVSMIGDTALAAETVRDTRTDLGRVAPVTLLGVGFVLIVFLRALVAPLYLLFASVLALAAALGLTVFVFQDLLGYDELTYFVPFVGAVLLVALGSDYNVFLAGRVWQEARHRPLREAVAVGGSRAATAITVAGIVLALSFALLALVPLRPFRELAFLMSAGLLLDAFLVRTVLVPALIALVGSASGWPGRELVGPPSLTDATPGSLDEPEEPEPEPVSSGGGVR